jgi:hypothetical protein
MDDELNRALALLGDAYDVTLIRLKPGYHCLIEELEKQLETALRSGLITDKSEVRLFFGERCLPDMKDFAKKHGVRLMPEINCLAAMVGQKKLMELEQNKTMVITPAWIRKMFLHPDGVPAFMSWDKTDFMINFGRYDTILVMDSTETPSDEEILEAYELFGGPVIDFVHVDPEYFNNLVRDFMA